MRLWSRSRIRHSLDKRKRRVRNSPSLSRQNADKDSIAIAHWVLIPLATLALSVADLLRRFRRTMSVEQAIASAAVTAAGWFVYIFLGLLPDYVDFLFAVLAAPGLAASLTYLALALCAFMRQKKLEDKTHLVDVAGAAGGVELDTRVAASTRSKSSERDGQKAANVEEHAWSPLR